MNGWAQLLVGVLALIATVLTTWMTVRRAGKRDRIDTTQQLIDQLQEERNTSDAKHTAELAQVRSEVGSLRGEVRELGDYVAELRHHIDQRKPPPPPPWPEGLLRQRA